MNRDRTTEPSCGGSTAQNTQKRGIYDVIIAGAGVIGSMLARELMKYRLSVCLLEKENDVAMGASKANSGIIHGGFDPEPGTLKAKLNVEGVPLLYEAARELNVPHKNNGSLVVAFGEKEESVLAALLARGVSNGVDGLSIISGDEARRLEPQLSREVTAALLFYRNIILKTVPKPLLIQMLFSFKIILSIFVQSILVCFNFSNKAVTLGSISLSIDFASSAAHLISSTRHSKSSAASSKSSNSSVVSVEA